MNSDTPNSWIYFSIQIPNIKADFIYDIFESEF
jgi:hypothetical protein